MRLRFSLILALVFLALPSALAIEIETLGRQMIVSGRVEANDEVKFRQALDAMPSVDTVVLRNSPGGRLSAGISIAEMIKARLLRTAVSGYCASACAIMFLGGHERMSTTEFPPHKTYVAFHGAYVPGGQNASELHYDLLGLFARLTDGRMPTEVTYRWTTLPQSGLIYFFDPAARLAASGSASVPAGPSSLAASVQICQGRVGDKTRDCEWLRSIDPYRVGVFTSRRPISVN